MGEKPIFGLIFFGFPRAKPNLAPPTEPIY